MEEDITPWIHGDFGDRTIVWKTNAITMLGQYLLAITEDRTGVIYFCEMIDATNDGIAWTNGDEIVVNRRNPIHEAGSMVDLERPDLALVLARKKYVAFPICRNRIEGLRDHEIRTNRTGPRKRKKL